MAGLFNPTPYFPAFYGAHRGLVNRVVLSYFRLGSGVKPNRTNIVLSELSRSSSLMGLIGVVVLGLSKKQMVWVYTTSIVALVANVLSPRITPIKKPRNTVSRKATPAETKGTVTSVLDRTAPFPARGLPVRDNLFQEPKNNGLRFQKIRNLGDGFVGWCVGCVFPPHGEAV